MLPPPSRSWLSEIQQGARPPLVVSRWDKCARQQPGVPAEGGTRSRARSGHGTHARPNSHGRPAQAPARRTRQVRQRSVAGRSWGAWAWFPRAANSSRTKARAAGLARLAPRAKGHEREGEVRAASVLRRPDRRAMGTRHSPSEPSTAPMESGRSRCCAALSRLAHERLARGDQALHCQPVGWHVALDHREKRRPLGRTAQRGQEPLTDGHVVVPADTTPGGVPVVDQLTMQAGIEFECPYGRSVDPSP